MTPLVPLEEQLNWAIEASGASWDLFEQTPDGCLLIREADGPMVLDFRMRIGLHMKQPKQAVMAYGKFVWMRCAKKYEAYPLTDLDPNNADTCLYYSHVQFHNGQASPLWLPQSAWWANPQDQLQQYQQQQYQQQYQQQLQANWVFPHYTTSNITTSSTSSDPNQWYSVTVS